MSNTYIIGATSQETKKDGQKWTFNYNKTHEAAKTFVLRSDLNSEDNLNLSSGNIHLVFELVFYTDQDDLSNQVTCGWGSLPLDQKLNKPQKLKIDLIGGNPTYQVPIEEETSKNP